MVSITDLRSNVRDWVYRRTRTQLPLRETTCNGVSTKRYRLGKKSETMPDVEAEAVDALHECVEEGDTVVVLGAGYGVTTVHAARAAGADGRVFAYEASGLWEVAKEAVERNDGPAKTSVEKLLVGEPIDVYGGHDDARRCFAEDLPTCDVMEIDIEGAELGVIEGLKPLPETIIVETHGHKGSSTEEVLAMLVGRGYEDIEVRDERHENDAVATVVARN
jgi:hypothetical protein